MMALNAKTENVALKAKLKRMVALNAETEDTALNAKLERDDGSKRWIRERWWLWTPKMGEMVALNTELEKNEGSEC